MSLKISALLLVALALPRLVSAQDNVSTDNGAPPGNKELSLQDSVKSLESQLTQLEQNVSTTEEVEEMRTEFEEYVFERQMSDAENSGDEVPRDERFSFWGFMDLTYNKYFMHDKSIMQLFGSSKSSFLMSNINIYFKSQMTRSLSSLIELKLTFLPHGRELDYEYGLYEKDEQGEWQHSMTTGEYVRQSMEVQDPFTTMYYRVGGLMIERAHLTYEVNDKFNIIAGRFLTPYGIWNVDHGSPVVIPAKLPYQMLREMVPPAQTGLQVYGRFFLGKSDLFLDYAVTLSNGHGPIEQLIDLDENKAVGLRLRGTYQSPNFRLSIGGFGMYGSYTDVKKVVSVYSNDDGTLAYDDKEMPFQVSVVDVKSMDEIILAADLLIDFYGLRLQSEFIWTRWDYSKTGPRYSQESLIAGAPPLTDFYRASNVGTGVYVILAYELPLAKLIGDFKITPFFLFEENKHDDTLPHAWNRTIGGGLNMKPSPFITLKLESSVAIPSVTLYGGNGAVTTAQMAVSF